MSVSGTAEPAEARRATEFLDYGSEEVRDFTEAAVAGVGSDPVDRAVALYYAVRDGIHYEIYGADMSRSGLRASSTVRSGSGLCLHKSVLYAAAVRSLDIPCRLVLANVRNHLSSERIRTLFGGDVVHHHCLVSVRLNGKWVRATPVFNRALCRLYRIAELDFDGTTDAVFHPYDLDGRRSMEFLVEHGVFDDLPYDRVIEDVRAAHPGLFAASDGGGRRLTAGSLVADASTPGTRSVP
ncbi:transglutaminase-like putative cysteine protease [Saccharothrix ecbatanensis]|uniref:Transglutaminase-like putative cysteine protease n=1 Tax=Saccharothrix ecbatanensis TaxID=1105145 RepID=A0A7W9HH75_9PSEU|nr:transglutaminase-like domain-containing protein [Saccharothrix ecbatanensis]MBB5802218.1 transglutaminase-like putative cysteine protease [Saccharothrix ecbatanensis]